MRVTLVGTRSLPVIQVALPMKSLPASLTRGAQSERGRLNNQSFVLQAKDGRVILTKKKLFEYLQAPSSAFETAAPMLEKKIVLGLPRTEKLKYLESSLAGQKKDPDVGGWKAKHIGKKESELPYTVYHTEKGFFADFKELLGEGSERIVRKVVDVADGAFLALGKVVIKTAHISRKVSTEIANLSRFKGCKEIIQLHYEEKHYSNKHDSMVCSLLYEYCDGGDLHGFLAQGTEGVDQTLWNVTIDILQALKFLEEKGVHHRDIKCQNILLYKGEDGTMHAKLADFGLSETFVAEKAAPILCGSPLYGAPEVFSGFRQFEKLETKDVLTEDEKRRYESALDLIASPKSDMWGFGMVLFQMRTGREVPEVLEKLSHVFEKEVAEGMGKHEAEFRFREACTKILQDQISNDPATGFAGRDFAHEPDSLAKLNFDMLQIDPKRRPPAAELLKRAIRLRKANPAFHSTFQPAFQPAQTSST